MSPTIKKTHLSLLILLRPPSSNSCSFTPILNFGGLGAGGCPVSCLAVCVSFSSSSVCSSRYIMQGVFIVGPLLFGLYSNGLFTSGLYPCGLSPFGLKFFGLFWTGSYSPFEVRKKEIVFSHVMNLVLVIRPVCSSKQPTMLPQPAAPTLTSGDFSSRFVEQRQNAAGLMFYNNALESLLGLYQQHQAD